MLYPETNLRSQQLETIPFGFQPSLSLSPSAATQSRSWESITTTFQQRKLPSPIYVFKPYVFFSPSDTQDSKETKTWTSKETRWHGRRWVQFSYRPMGEAMVNTKKGSVSDHTPQSFTGTFSSPSPTEQSHSVPGQPEPCYPWGFSTANRKMQNIPKLWWIGASGCREPLNSQKRGLHKL